MNAMSRRVLALFLALLIACPPLPFVTLSRVWAQEVEPEPESETQPQADDAKDEEKQDEDTIHAALKNYEDEIKEYLATQDDIGPERLEQFLAVDAAMFERAALKCMPEDVAATAAVEEADSMVVADQAELIDCALTEIESKKSSLAAAGDQKQTLAKLEAIKKKYQKNTFSGARCRDGNVFNFFITINFYSCCCRLPNSFKIF